MDAAHIRRLTTDDALIYRDIRIESRRCNPDAYGGTLEAEIARPLPWYLERLGDSNVFGAFHNSELVGIGELLIGDGEKEAHKGLLRGMYVRPSSRKAGVGRRLAETIIDFARERVELILLTVVSENEEARRLYDSLGFLEYGIEKNSLKQHGRYYDEVLMSRDLRQDSN